MLINENNTTKKCFKCGDELNVVTEICKKKIGEREYEKWSKSDLRNVRYCKNISCVEKKHKRFYIGRDINAANNMLINGLKNLSGVSNLNI